jgi:hypothetical protein
LRVPAAFPDVGAVGDWVAGRDVVLCTDVQTLHYGDAGSRTFHGGVMHVRNLHVMPRLLQAR